jgi:putative ABC transport system permease protein
MQLGENLLTAVLILFRHKLRTLLTMLGIIFGVGAVISMLSIGAGAEAESMKVIDSMGLRNIIFREKEAPEREVYTTREKSQGLTLTDIDGIRTLSPEIVRHAARKQVRTDRILALEGRTEARVLGVSHSYFSLYNLRTGSGALFDEVEEREFRRVCVLGRRSAEELFGYRDPIGRAVKINDVWFTVVGILGAQHLDREAFQGVKLESVDTDAYIPVTTALKMFDFGPLASELDEVVLQVAEGASIESNTRLVAGVLKDLHGGLEDFTVVVPEQLLAQSKRTRQIFNIVMGGIAGISLLVGGIGIMNIMLANVLERTREIGVRRAIGARRRDILIQFLTEAITISGIGGLLGVLTGCLIAWSVSILSDWHTLITGLSVILAFTFAATIGLIFGTYPAVRASRLDPIESLRYE